MFDDAATGLLGFHALAKFNPLRWSGSQSFDATIFQLELVLEQNDRPILIKTPANTGKAVRFPTTQQAIDFLKRCEEVHDAQKAKEPRAKIKAKVKTACIGGHTEYELDVCEGIHQWSVQRRYSQFIDLNERLKAVPGFQTYELPPKGMFGLRHACNIGNFNQKRQEGLNKYLSEIVSQASSLADVPALAEFLGLPTAAGATFEGQAKRNVLNDSDVEHVRGEDHPSTSGTCTEVHNRHGGAASVHAHTKKRQRQIWS